MGIHNVSKYYPVSRHRNILTQDYISEVLKNGLQGFSTYEEAKEYLWHYMDTDDCDYEVCVYIDGKWFATRDGRTTVREIR